MTDVDTVRVTFTCSHCGSTNELTATHVHSGTIIHCSRCSVSAGALGDLCQKRPAPARIELVGA